MSPGGEAALRDEDLGFGSIDTEELWAQRLDEPFKPIAGFDLAAQLEEMGVLAGEPKIAGVFTYYPLKECPFNTEHKKGRSLATPKRHHHLPLPAPQLPGQERRLSTERPPVITSTTTG